MENGIQNLTFIVLLVVSTSKLLVFFCGGVTEFWFRVALALR